MPEWEFYELSPLLDSSNMTVREWNCIAELIAQKYDDYDGFVVLHGTDTMAYTASALSFMLDGLDKPVVLTGSQIPLCEIRSDGRDNLITALLIAGEGVVREVCLYFGGKLLRGLYVGLQRGVFGSRVPQKDDVINGARQGDREQDGQYDNHRLFHQGDRLSINIA